MLPDEGRAVKQLGSAQTLGSMAEMNGVRRVPLALLCLRLQRGCGVRGWGPDGLGTGGVGARAFMLLTPCSPRSRRRSS
jgi:hypothetical protein